MSPAFDPTPMPRLVSDVLAHEGLGVVRVIRNGPRYWVGKVERAGEKLILKVVIQDDPWESPRTKRVFRPSDQLRAEIAALRELQQYSARIVGATPRLLSVSERPDTWSLRELVEGSDMSGTAGPFIFSESFYAQVKPATLVEHIRSYQRLTPELLSLVQSTPKTDQTDLRSKIIMGDLGNPQIFLEPMIEPVRHYLAARIEAHDAAVTTLSHGEVYPPHIFFSGTDICLIDWENVSLNTVFNDFMAVWLRAFDNPAWQSAFLGAVRSSEPDGLGFDQELWDMELIIHASSILNYLYWSQVETSAQKQMAVAALQSYLREALGRAA